MRLDSTKIKLQLETLDFNPNFYDESIINRAEGGSLTKYVLCEQIRKQHIGLNSIDILPTNNEVLIQCSSKILAEQYLDGININTLERLHSNILPYISCSLAEFTDSILCRADITDNLYFETRDAKELAIQALRLGKSNTAFKVDDLTDKFNFH